MAASYFGIFDNQAHAQQALDQGKLYKPFVAMWEDTVHYDDLDETNEGSLSTNELTGVTSAQTQEYVEIYGDGLYWAAESSESWITFDGDHYEGYGDDGFTLNIDSNDVTEPRYAEIRVTFYYDDQHEVVRNVQNVFVAQEAHEPLPTGATVTLSNSQLGSYSSWQYLQVSDADGLYWAAVPPEWINNGEGFNSEGNNAWWFEVPENATQDREGTFNVEFYSDGAHENWLFGLEATLEQQGRGEYAPSFNADYYVPSTSVAYESGQTTVYIIDNPGYAFQVLVDSYEVTGTSSTTAVYISYDENDNYNQQNKTVTVVFYEDEQLSQAVDTKYLSINQEGNPDAMFVEWEGGDSTFPASGGSRNFEIFFDNPDTTQYAISLDSGIGHFNWGGGSVTSFTANTADVATGVTFFAQANTGSTPIYGSIGVTALDANDQQIGYYPLSFTIQEVQPQVTVVGTFITTSDNQTVAVPAYDNGNWMNAYIDGDPTDVLPTNTWSYTFPSAGTHTITYVRESSDTYLQGWFMDSDVVSVSGTSTTEWGGQGNGYYQSQTSMVFAGNTQLTGATFDMYFNRIGSSCFSGCTSLVYLAFNNPDGVNFDGTVYPFDTITANAGTVHIPSGKQTEYADIITALGNNWTVVDDL